MRAVPAAPAHWPKRGPILTALALFLVLFSTVPTYRWIPDCGGEPVEGDYRDIYVDLFVRWLDQTGVYYWRFGDVVLIRELGWGDGDELLDRGEVILKGETGIADYLSEDQVIDGVLHPAPEAVKRLKVELAPIIGPDPRILPDGRVAIGSDTRVSRHCTTLFRAAILEPDGGAPRQ
jgi:hypothetical protein